MMQLAEKYYRLLVRVSSSLQSPFLLAVRLYWGWQFMQTGWGKLSDINKVVGFFTNLGIPAPALNGRGARSSGWLLLISAGISHRKGRSTCERPAAGPAAQRRSRFRKRKRSPDELNRRYKRRSGNEPRAIAAAVDGRGCRCRRRDRTFCQFFSQAIRSPSASSLWGSS
jgi:hypothetical protein